MTNDHTATGPQRNISIAYAFIAWAVVFWGLYFLGPVAAKNIGSLYDARTDDIYPYAVLAVLYLLVAVLPENWRDRLGLTLVLGFCVALGLRDIYRMPLVADSITYSFIMSRDVLIPPGHSDYAVLGTIGGTLGPALGPAGCLFLLQLMYVPLVLLLYRYCRTVAGTFYLLAGWALFSNSGVLLLANFFRQGLSTFLFMALVASISTPTVRSWRRWLGAGMLPLLHTGSVAVAPALLIYKWKRYPYVLWIGLAALCVAIPTIVKRYVIAYADYIYNAAPSGSAGAQLIAKVAVSYAVLLLALSLATRTPDALRDLRRAAVGIVASSAALLGTLHDPIFGLRLIYYFHSVAFLLLAFVVAARRDWTGRVWAVGFCCFGLLTWTYPTVTRVLVW